MTKGRQELANGAREQGEVSGPAAQQPKGGRTANAKAGEAEQTEKLEQAQEESAAEKTSAAAGRHPPAPASPGRERFSYRASNAREI